jgi:superfamily II DNA or RNA helicase
MLRNLSLRYYYRSDKNNLLNDFYIPCLSESIHYSRAVGFFTSSSLSAAARGLNVFIKRGGTVRLVASPNLSKDDIAAIQQGYRTREEVIEECLVQAIKDVAMPDPVRQRLGFLAWLIAEGMLDIKIAIVETSGGFGIYHEKVGIFTDEYGDRVVFTGSSNESTGGFVSNFESVDVFRSWIEADEGRIQPRVDDFQRLWNDLTPSLRVYDFPEAARRELLNYKPATKPSRDPEQQSPPESPESSPDVQLYNNPFLKIELKPRQIEALDAWKDANCRGILAMATGSGKTVAALACALSLENLEFLLISVPTNELVHQWVREIKDKTTYQPPIIAVGASASWTDTLFRKLRLHNSRLIPADRCPTIVVGNYNELSKQRTLNLLNDAGGVPHSSLLIADEVHSAGASGHQRILRGDFTYRLGLSATPLRPYDEEGTDVVLRYFEGIVYEFSLEQAIAAGILCEYDYFVYMADLTKEEYEEYRKLTAKMGFLLGSRQEVAASRSINLDFLAIKRAHIVKSAESKLALLDRITREHSLRKAMVYCADIAQATEASRILTRQGYHVARYSSDDVDRHRLLASFAAEELDALVAVKCLDEGVDIPATELAAVLASDASERQFIQRRGRVLRTAPKKRVATIIDVLVVPPPSEASVELIGFEMSRVVQFARAARNRMSLLQDLAQKLAPYGVTPSDIF